MARIRKDHWQRQIEKLDPDKDYEEITRISSEYEFPWDFYQALSLTLFRTYAVPSIGGLLHDTAGFSSDVQKRHDDTAIILFAIGDQGMDSPDGHAAVRRMNQMHGSYDISNADMLYVLSAFVVTPSRWIDAYGWRPRMAAEQLAGVRYWQRLGRLMGIKGIPETYEEIEDYFDRYEADNFAYNEKSVAVANTTLGLFETFYPRFARRPANMMLRALMDDHLLAAFGFRKPPALIVFLARKALRLRGRFVRLLPARKTPKLIDDYREIRSYPGGFMIDNLGTFPTGGPSANGRPAHGQGVQEQSSDAAG